MASTLANNLQAAGFMAAASITAIAATTNLEAVAFTNPTTATAIAETVGGLVPGMEMGAGVSATALFAQRTYKEAFSPQGSNSLKEPLVPQSRPLRILQTQSKAEKLTQQEYQFKPSRTMARKLF